MQKHVNLVDLVKSFPTSTLLQNLASIEQRTSPLKFDHLAEKSENGSISNLSTKVLTSFCIRLYQKEGSTYLVAQRGSFCGNSDTTTYSKGDVQHKRTQILILNSANVDLLERRPASTASFGCCFMFIKEIEL